jgi:hypothetical protein
VVSLAHRGMLFLGEQPELRRHVLESLCEPIEKGFTTIESRHMEISGKSGRILVRLIYWRLLLMQTRQTELAKPRMASQWGSKVLILHKDGGIDSGSSHGLKLASGTCQVPARGMNAGFTREH